MALHPISIRPTLRQREWLAAEAARLGIARTALISLAIDAAMTAAQNGGSPCQAGAGAAGAACGTGAAGAACRGACDGAAGAA